MDACNPVMPVKRLLSGRTFAVVVLILVVGGCAVGVDAPRPAPTVVVPDTFSSSGEAELAARWWWAFDDPALSALVEEALTGSVDLAAARARLAQARAVWRQSGAATQPTLDFAAGATEGEAVADDGSRSDADSRSLALTAAYEVDLWGRIEAAARADELAALASAQALQTVALSVSAEVARHWFGLAAARRQVELLRGQERTAADYLQVLKLRFGAGQARAADVLQQRDLIASLRADSIQAEALLSTTRHALAALLGRPPDQAPTADAAELPTMPPLPATGLPAQLLERRPDLRGAWLQLRAAEQEVAVAVAQRYPRLNVTGSLTSRRSDWSGLLENWSRSLVADLVAPLIDGGARTAQVERARARADELLADYRATLLDALVEVEDALVRERAQRGYLAELERRVGLGRELLERQRDYYRSGGGDFLNVLDAQRSLQARERHQIDARQQLIEYRIALYRALAGGFMAPEAAPTESES